MSQIFDFWDIFGATFNEKSLTECSVRDFSGEDEICSGAERLRISRGLREQCACCGEGTSPFADSRAAGKLAFRRHGCMQKDAAKIAASCKRIALRGEDEIRTRDTVTSMQV